MTDVRCLDCAHFTGRGKLCTLSRKRKPVYQSGAWRSCESFRQPVTDAPQPPTQGKRKIGIELLPDWTPERDKVSPVWQVAHLESMMQVTYYRMVFPSPVNGQAACVEAGRHWSKFRIKAGKKDD